MLAPVARTYAAVRRVVRSVIKRNATLDRTVGKLLRKLESLGPVDRLVAGLATGDVLECQGFRLSYPRDDPSTVSELLLYGDYEPETRRLLESLLVPGMSFVDMGANLGYFTLLAARRVGQTGRVYSFEPAPSTMRFLRRNVSLNGFDEVVTLVERAVSDRADVVPFAFDRHYSVGAHIAQEGSGGEIPVQTTSLDLFLSELGWPDVHVVKMDIEGAELAAFAGMRETIRRMSYLAVVFEFLGDTFENDATRVASLFASLHEFGLERFRVINRDGTAIALPGDVPSLLALSRVANVNILAEKGSFSGHSLRS